MDIIGSALLRRVTQDRLDCTKVMCIGLKNAASAFQKLMTWVRKQLRHTFWTCPTSSSWNGTGVAPRPCKFSGADVKKIAIYNIGNSPMICMAPDASQG